MGFETIVAHAVRAKTGRPGIRAVRWFRPIAGLAARWYKRRMPPPSVPTTAETTLRPAIQGLDLIRFEALKAAGDLPSPKAAALAIIRLTTKENVTLGEVAQATKSDPAFVGRLIKAANGLHPSGGRPVASVKDALVLLGIPAVRSLALGFSLLASYGRGRCANFPYARFWSHSLARAIALQELTIRTRAAAPEEAFSVGLLSSVGELALATVFPDRYSELLGAVVGADAEEIRTKQREAFAINDREMTACMLLDWGLPKTFVEPVYFRDHPDSAPFPEGSRPAIVTQSLYLAERIADFCVAEDHARHGLMPEILRCGGRLSLDDQEMSGLCDSVARQWQEWGAMLSVRTSKVPTLDELSQGPPPPSVMTGAPQEAKTTVPMRILLVDDDKVMRTLQRSLLAAAGHQVFEAENGIQGLEMAMEVRPQIMVIDWVMPEMDGLDLTRSLRQSKVGRSIYILLLTALEDDDHLVQAFDAGVDDFLGKPLKPRVLAARLRAGQRVVQLQEEIEKDREEIRRFAGELAVTNRRLHEAALTDPLTRLPNRRYAMERLQQEWAAALRHGRALCCMAIDVDRFKEVNDRHGHDVGDQVLQELSNAVRSSIRAEDVVCRVGGDEFLVICPDTTLEPSLLVAERVRRSVGSIRIRCDDALVGTSVSIGVAQREDAMTHCDALIKSADLGAYAAKQRGRDNVATIQRPNGLPDTGKHPGVRSQ